MNHQVKREVVATLIKAVNDALRYAHNLSNLPIALKKGMREV